MSEAIGFDAHRFVKRLTDCGFPEKQAETPADEDVALLNDDLATKTDTANVEARIEAVKGDRPWRRTVKRSAPNEQVELPPEVESQIIPEVYDRHYRETLDQPIPMLDDIYPRVTAKTPEGKERHLYT